jgi:hypothetical protein
MRTDSSRGFGAAVAPAVTNGGTTAALMLGAPAPLSLPLSNCPGFFLKFAVVNVLFALVRYASSLQTDRKKLKMLIKAPQYQCAPVAPR